MTESNLPLLLWVQNDDIVEGFIPALGKDALFKVTCVRAGCFKLEGGLVPEMLRPCPYATIGQAQEAATNHLRAFLKAVGISPRLALHKSWAAPTYKKGSIGSLVKSMPEGEWFDVTTPTERQAALAAGQRHGIPILTEAIDAYGFRVWRVSTELGKKHFKQIRMVKQALSSVDAERELRETHVMKGSRPSDQEMRVARVLGPLLKGLPLKQLFPLIKTIVELTK